MRSYYKISEFLQRSRCDDLVTRARRSQLYDQDKTISNKGLEQGAYRTSESFTLIDRQLFVEMERVLKIERHRLERPLLIRYQKGNEFKPHLDFHIEGTEGYEQRVRNGQRTLSFVFYLNDDYEGGELYFDKLNVRIKPSTGDLLIIVNQFLNGEMNWDSSHASSPVGQGTKYILLVNYTGTYDLNVIEGLSVKDISQ